MKHHKTLFAGALVAGIATISYAGKEEREMYKEQVAPAVTKATQAWKAACGCALSITVDDNTKKSTDDLRMAAQIPNVILDSVAGYCTDADSKKAMCQLKSIHIAKAATAEFKIAGGKGTWTHDGQARPGWDMVAAAVDK